MRKHQRLPRTRERAITLHQWIREFQRTNHYSPSFAEVSEALSLSTSHIKKIREAMVEFRLMWPVGHGIERAWPLRPIPKDFTPPNGA